MREWKRGEQLLPREKLKNIVQGRKNKFKLSFRDAALFHSLPRIFLMFLNASRKKPLDMNRASQSVDVHFQSSLFLVVPHPHTTHDLSCDDKSQCEMAMNGLRIKKGKKEIRARDSFRFQLSRNFSGNCT